MKGFPHPRIAIAGAMALAAPVLALLHLFALVSGGDVQVAGWRLAPMAAGYDRAAESLLAPKHPAAADVDKAEALTRLALREFPYDTSSWLRIAYIDQLRHGEISPVGIAALVRSYDLVAADRASGPWRVHFALEHWNKLPKDLRNSTREEVKAFATDKPSRAKLKAALAAVQNPNSAVMVTLWRQRYVDTASRNEHITHEKAALGGGY